MSWLETSNLNRIAIRIVASAAFLLAAVPGMTQTEGPEVPNPENIFSRPTMAEGFLRAVQPQSSAEAAPRAETKRQRMRNSSRAKVSRPDAISAQSTSTEQQQHGDTSRAWPNAEASAGTGEIVPVVLKTVREILELNSEAEVVHANELSDIDLAAGPPALPIALAATDGSASRDAEEPAQANRFSAVMENVHGITHARWFEPVLLMMAGAIAAVSAMRLFA